MNRYFYYFIKQKLQKVLRKTRRELAPSRETKGRKKETDPSLTLRNENKFQSRVAHESKNGDHENTKNFSP